MGLETGTFIEDLVSSNPLGTDPKSEGDDHLRLIKSTILASFPNTTGAWNTANSITAGEAQNANQLMQLGQQRKIASGTVNTNGQVLGGSGDFSVSRLGEGEYRLTFNDSGGSQYGHNLTASAFGLLAVGAMVSNESATQIKVFTYLSSSGAQVDAFFSFQRIVN